MNLIKEGRTINIHDNQRFNCRIKLLDYVLKTQEYNEFLPRKAMYVARSKLVEMRLNKEQEKGLTAEKNKEFEMGM